MKTHRLLGFVLAIAAGMACTKKDTNPPDGKAACTEEAKQCPDGSSVVRGGPNCEFAECPSASGEGEPAADSDAAPAEGGEEKPAEGGEEKPAEG